MHRYRIGKVQHAAQATISGAALGKYAPTADDLLNRRQSASQQSRGRDHDTGSSFALDHQPSTQPKHQDLHGLAYRACDRCHHDRFARGWTLQRCSLGILRAPARQQGVGHAERLSDLGVL